MALALESLITIIVRLVSMTTATALVTISTIVSITTIVTIITVAASITISAIVSIISSTATISTVTSTSVSTVLTIEVWLADLIVLLIKLRPLLASWRGCGLESWDNSQRVVKEKRYDLASFVIGENLLNKLVKARITFCSLLDRLITKLCKLTEEELLCCRGLRLNELNFSKLLEEVEICDVHSCNEAHYLLCLGLAFSHKAGEVHLWVSRN